ncbi:MAG: hypothetical protein JXB03_04070 [Spirochaetales bacterium]|nr:hypothetical protein [Spirochaetales bacterium]
MGITQVYRNSSFEVQLKAPLLFKVQVFVMATLTILLINEIVFFNLATVILLPLLIGAVAVSLVLLRSGRYKTAVLVCMTSLAVILFLLPFAGVYDHMMVFSHTAFTFTITLLLVFFFSPSKVFTKTILIAAAAVYTLRLVMAAAMGEFQGVPLDSVVIVPTVLFALAALILRVIFNLVQSLLDDSRDRIRLLEENEAGMRKVLEASAEQMQKGEGLSSSAAETAAASVEIESNVAGIQTQVTQLSNGVKDTDAAVRQIGDSIQSLNAIAVNQSSHIVQTSAAIEEMVASIRNVSTIIDAKKVSVDSLKDSSMEGEKAIQQTANSFARVREQIDNIKQMTGIIGAIASQTNLLAMNAAIEAAHAGDAGRGFAVVADEVRKLAESSSSNAKQIGQILKELLSAIDTAGENVGLTGNTFADIHSEVEQVSAAMAEIAASTEELQKGSGEILSATTSLNENNSGVTDGVQHVEEAQHRVTDNMKKVTEVLSLIVSGIAEIKAGAGEIRTAMESLQSLSLELQDHSRTLNETISR